MELQSPQLLTLREAAKRLNRSERTLREWCAGDTLEAQKLGGVWFIWDYNLTPKCKVRKKYRTRCSV